MPKARRKALPPAQPKALCQAVVPRILFEAAKDEWTRRGHSTRQVIAWALKSYLTSHNPTAAQAVEKALNAGP